MDTFINYVLVIYYSANAQVTCATSERTINTNFANGASTTYVPSQISNYNRNGWTGSGTGNINQNSNGFQFYQDGISSSSPQTITQSITNANLKGNGAVITLVVNISRANPNNTSSSTLTISYGGVQYVIITQGVGSGSATASVSASNGSTVSSTSFSTVDYLSYTPSTLTITLPSSIPNNGDLVVGFYSGGSSGDFLINSLSFKACPLTFSGSILDDANGLTDNAVNSSGSVAIPSGLYVNLVNGTTFVAGSAVASNGSYSFSSTGSIGTQPTGNNYNLVLTTSSTGTTATLPSGWLNTGKSTTSGGANITTGDSGLIITNIANSTSNTDKTYYYGIDAKPTAATVSKGPYNIAYFPLTDLANYRGILSSDANTSPLSGTDPEDGSFGTNSTFKIENLTNGTRLFYGSSAATGTELINGSSITNYNPALLRMYSPLTSTGVYFTYSITDKANVKSPPASYSVFSDYALPVILDKFKVNVTNNIANISWIGVTELNFKYYEIQQSNDSKDFTPIIQISGTGSGSSYSYDYTLSQELTYFRLKMVDLDGTVSYSDIVSVSSNSTAFAPVLFPNPVINTLNVKNLGNLQKNILISNLNGVILYKSQSSADQLNINTSSFVSGMYILNLQYSNGKKITMKFIKK